MNGWRRKTGPAALLAVLALASFAAAAITITNITEWRVVAQHPPIVKVAGSDVGTYVNVDTYTAGDGTNRTRIIITGFTGDPTYYSEPLKICNKDYYYSANYRVSLQYKQVLNGSWAYVKYLKFWINESGPLTVTSNGADGIAEAIIAPGQCVPVAVEVLVVPEAPTGPVLIAVEIDVVSTTPP